MKLKSLALAGPFIALLISCSAHVDLPDNPAIQSGNIPDYASGPLAGKINGQAWSLGHGVAATYVSNGQSTLYLSFGQTASSDPCAPVDTSGSGGSYVTASAPNQTGETKFNVFTVPPVTIGYAGPQGETSAFANGKIRIDSVTATQVTGHLVAQSDADNTVNGAFTVSICNSDH